MEKFAGSNKDTYRIRRPEVPKEIVFDCNQYPVRKLIAVGDRIEVIYLYKIPVYDNLPV